MTTPVTREEFVSAMGAVCTPVAVVATYDDRGNPMGTTVSAFLSLSADPPMILVSLARTSRLLGAVQQGRSFSVNILGSSAGDLAMSFATKGDNKFDGVNWDSARRGPRLHAAASWVGCELVSEAEGGDHIVLQGLIHETHLNDLTPLVYHNRTFGTFASAV